MERISNRLMSKDSIILTQIEYKDKIVEIPVLQESKIEYVDRIIEVPVEKIIEVEKIIHMEAKEVDLIPIYEQLRNNEIANNSIVTELDMQSRAIIDLKAQTKLDRSRRLALLMRLKSHRSEQRKVNKKLVILSVVSLLTSIISLIIKL